MHTDVVPFKPPPDPYDTNIVLKKSRGTQTLVPGVVDAEIDDNVEIVIPPKPIEGINDDDLVTEDNRLTGMRLVRNVCQKGVSFGSDDSTHNHSDEEEAFRHHRLIKAKAFGLRRRWQGVEFQDGEEKMPELNQIKRFGTMKQARDLKEKDCHTCKHSSKD